VTRLAPLALAASLAACGGAQGARGTTAAEARECTAALRFEEPEGETLDADPDAEPHTRITLVLICDDETTTSMPVGTEVGACFRTEPPGGVLLGARCWWAGQGAVLEVRREGGALRVRRTLGGETSDAGALDVPTESRVRPL
jgi:hypothetical protein